MNAEILGYIGGILSCVTFVPQIFKTFQSRSVKDVSITTFGIVVLSTLIWLAYGIMENLMPVIITNVVVCLSAIAMIIMKLQFTEREEV